jgi:hypothetical protein
MSIRLGLGGALVTLVIVAAGGVAVWTAACPCDRTPGFVLLGEMQEKPITDWRFANDVSLCQIQVLAGWRPHAVNLNCFATPEGELFLGCANCASKYWSGYVGPDESGRLRLNGAVYPVVVNRVLDPAVMDRAWAARVTKLQKLGDATNPAPAADAKRPDSWWTFQVRSASAG